MQEIKSYFIDMNHLIDRVITTEGYETDDSIKTAVLISLFTDARADKDDNVPNNDLRGVWVDAMDPGNLPTGSKRWLLAREKQTNETLNRLIEYDSQALQWLINNGYATNIEINAEWISRGVLQETIIIDRADKQLQINLTGAL